MKSFSKVYDYVSLKCPHIKETNTEFITASGVSKYTIHSKFHARLMFGSEDLKLPTPDRAFECDYLSLTWMILAHLLP